MPTVKYLDTERGRAISERFPKWTVERKQAFSRTRRLGNIISNVASDMNLANRIIGEARSLVTTRPVDYICESYITELVDVSGESTVPFSTTGVSFVSGEMESGSAAYPLTKVNSEIEYLNSDETGFYARKEVALDGLTGQLKGEYNSTSDIISLTRVIDNTNVNVNVGFDISESANRDFTTVGASVLGDLIIKSVTKQVTNDDKSFLLDRPLPETIRIYSITASGETLLESGAYQLTESGTIVDSTSGEFIRLVKELDIVDKYGTDYDFNKDGVIDDFDVSLIEENVGKRLVDFSVDYWEANYAKFDLDSDGIVTDKDVSIIAQHSISTKERKKAVFYIYAPGNYRVEYQTTGDGLGITSYRTIKRDGIEIDIRNGRSEVFPDEILDPDGITYEYHPINTDILISINQNECSLTFYKISIMNTLVDRFKIALPVSGIEARLIGSTTRDTDLYVLAVVDGVHQIFRIDLSVNKVAESIVSLPIYTGKNADKRLIRDSYVFTDPSDIIVIDGSLVVIDQGKLIFLGEVYDIFYYDATNARYYTRSRFDKLNLGTLPANQVYFNIWNKFDEYGILKGIPRLPGEENVEYKRRLLELWERFPNSGLQGILNGITRELDITRESLNNKMFIEMPGVVADIDQSLEIRLGAVLTSITAVVEIPVYTTLDTVMYNKYEVKDDSGTICIIDRGTITFSKNHPLLPANTQITTTVSCLIYDPTSGFSRPISVTDILIHNESTKTHANYLYNKEYSLNPVNGWFDTSGAPTNKLYDLLDRIEVDQGGFWSNSITDDNFYDVRRRDNMAYAVDLTLTDTPALPSGDHISGIGDAVDLAIVGIVRMKTDRVNDIVDANILTYESGTFLNPSSGEFYSVSGDIKSDVYDDLEKFHPVIQSGYTYLRDQELYAYSNKTTEMRSTPLNTSVFSGIYIYELSGEPVEFTPIIVERSPIALAADLFVSGDFIEPMFADAVFLGSGDFTVKYSDMILNHSEPSGVFNFHPGSRFAYTSGEFRELVPTFNDIRRAVDYISQNGLKYAHVNQVSGDLLDGFGNVTETFYKDVNAIVTSEIDPVLITYETGDPQFVESDIDISPLTTGFEDTIVAIGREDNTPVYVETYSTHNEVIGESGAFIDFIVGVYNQDYSPVPNVSISVMIEREVKNKQGVNVSNTFNGREWNGQYYWDDYTYTGLVQNDIIFVNGMASGVVDKNRKRFLTQSIGMLESGSIITNVDGVAKVRYHAPINERKAFEVTFSQLIDGWTADKTVKTNITVTPRNPLGFQVRGPDSNGLTEIMMKELFLNLESGTNVVQIEVPIGGYPDVSIYDAQEYTALKKAGRTLPNSGEHTYAMRQIPDMRAVSGDIVGVSGDYLYNLYIPMETSGAMPAVLVYNLLQKEAMTFDLGEVWR